MANKATHKIKKMHKKLLKGEMLSKSRFSKANLAVFALIFSSIGFYSISNSHAPSNYYISTTGSDSNSCTLSSPCRTLHAGTTKMSSGDTLYIRGGTYDGSSTGFRYADLLPPSGTSGAQTVIKAYPGETPVFDGYFTEGAAFIFASSYTSASYVTLDGLTLQHYNDNFGDGTIGVQASSHITLQNLTLRENGCYFDPRGVSSCESGGGYQNDHLIYVNGQFDNLTIRNNHFEAIPGGAIHIYHYPQGTGLRIENNVFVNDFWGVIACDGVSDVHVVNNTFYKTVSYGNETSYGPPSASVQTDCGSTIIGPSQLYLRNNVSYISGNGSVGFKKNGTGTFVEDYNIWYGGGVVGGTMGSHDSTANPLFASAPNDLSLQSSSPAINTGTSTDAPTTDINGSSRPVGVAYDMGAYEYGKR